MPANVNGWVQQYTDRFRPALTGVARISATFATATLERLDRIAEALETDTRTRTRIDPLIFTGAGTKTLEVPVGENWRLKLLAVSAAMTVTIRSGGVLRFTSAIGQANTLGPDCQLSAGPGAPIDITATAAGEVTLHTEVTEPAHPTRARNTGDKLPAGLPSNSVALEIERHFPDTVYGQSAYLDAQVSDRVG